MKYIHYMVGLLLIAGSMISCTSTPKDNELSSKEKEEGWELLFNGKDFTGWRVYGGGEPDSLWKVADGVLSSTPKGTRTFIMTADQYENFELSLEWKIGPQGNSGILYRLTEPGWAPGRAPEYQLIDQKGWKGKLKDEQHTAANYDMDKPVGSDVKPVGEWNTTKIIVNGANVQHYLNGVKVVEYDLWTDEWYQKKANSKWKNEKNYGMAKKGHIALQGHGGETGFRNIKIRKL